MGKPVDVAIIVVYLAAMLRRLLGQDADRRTRLTSLSRGNGWPDALHGTMAAVVLGGASTSAALSSAISSAISGMWLVVAIVVAFCC